jgi:hypothetical protein
VLTIEHASLDSDGQPASDAAAEALDDHIRILLPLDLRTDDADQASEGDPVGELFLALPKTLDKELVRAVAEASLNGENAVTRALGRRLDDVLSEETPS